MIGGYGKTTRQRPSKEGMSALVKDFRCGPRREGAAWCSAGPRWKSSQGGSRGELGGDYGVSAPWSMVSGRTGTLIWVAWRSPLAVRASEISVSGRFLSLRPVVRTPTGSPGTTGAARAAGTQRGNVSDEDGRFVMRPAPSAVHGTSASVPGGRFRRCAWGRRSRGMARGG